MTCNSDKRLLFKTNGLKTNVNFVAIPTARRMKSWRLNEWTIHSIQNSVASRL